MSNRQRKKWLCPHLAYRRVIRIGQGSESRSQSAHDECVRCGRIRDPYKNDRRVKTIVEFVNGEQRGEERAM